MGKLIPPKSDNYHGSIKNGSIDFSEQRTNSIPSARLSAPENGNTISKTNTAWTKTAPKAPKGIERYARLHGAKHDNTLDQWIVLGEVLPELIELLPIPDRPFHRTPDPFCPRCGAHMLKRTHRKTEFWRCSDARKTDCRGRISLEESLDALPKSFPRRAADSCFQPKSNKITGTVGTRAQAIPISPRLRQAIKDIAELAQAVLSGNPREWLINVKVGLGYKELIRVMKTLNGCQLVCDLLNKLADKTQYQILSSPRQ